MEITKKGLATIIVGAAILGGVIERAVSNQERLTLDKKIVEKFYNDVTTTITEKTNKDGTTEKETVIVDRTKHESKATENLEITKSTPDKDWFVSVSADNNRRYALDVKRRILGPIYLGGFADTDRRFGVSLGMSF